ncbi:RHS repeat protein [Clostridium sp. 'deep sea']|uniref:RHS repeat-associated core domain-containing protein n=1 Tax=Clostridium sp. 'deep sea' TaxID=2779445 RepID=UPI0018964361|nr:RHS repeat-associated core domain-containing protein [Clostridium sp. 'deep sea']QOR35895.1 RHS repeat protein [Clostridium sp. 'deep sea']
MIKLKKISFGLIVLLMILTINTTFAKAESPQESLEGYLNNLVGPSKLYNTSLSPVFLRNNYTDEYINPRSGDLTITQTDYYLPGRNGLDVEIKRIYKSGTSNVQNMNVKYVNGAWVDYVEYDAKTVSFYEKRYNLGIGTRFSFPTMEIKETNQGYKHMYLHTEAGDVYSLNPVLRDAVLTYVPAAQTVKDVYLRESTHFNNGQSDGISKYVMTNKAGKNTYFAKDGRILGIVDRYGNTIQFKYTTLTYKVDNTKITKRLISEIIDTVGRKIKIEYSDDANYKVGAKENPTYNLHNSYTAYQNPNNIDSGNLKNKFKVTITLPNNKHIIYHKSAVLVSNSKHVIRTRLQSVIDMDNQPKYHFWYEQPDLGFTFTNANNYSAYNKYENLVQIDYCKQNRIKRYTYNSYTKELSQGSMQYRKIYRAEELIKKDFNYNNTDFLNSFITEVKDKTQYSYNNEPDGYGTEGYNNNDYTYLKDSFKYSTEVKDINGSTNTYTYDGLHQLINSVKEGDNHKQVATSEYDEMKLVKKKQNTIYNKKNGVITGEPANKVENYRYDTYGNLLNYTGPLADRDEQGYPVDDKHTITYAYDYKKYHVLKLKTFNQNENSICQTVFNIDSNGNIISKKQINNTNNNKNIVTEYQYDTYGNLVNSTVKNTTENSIKKYVYSTDINGVDHKGAYLTKEIATVNGAEIEKNFAYNFKTGNLIKEIDGNGNYTAYEYDDVERLIKTKQTNNTQLQYNYIDNKTENRKIEVINEKGVKALAEYDTLGCRVKYSINKNNNWIVTNTIEYDAKGNKIKETDSNKNSVAFTYDSAYRLVKKSFYDKENGSVPKESVSLSYTINPGSNTKLLLTLTDDKGYKKQMHYDIANRLIKYSVTQDKINFHNNIFSYDYTGKQLTSVDPKGNAHKKEYDDLGRLKAVSDPLNNRVQYNYDSLNNVTEIIEPADKITKNIYDTLGRLIESRVFKKGESNYIYNKYSYDNNDNTLKHLKGEVKNDINTITTDITFVYDKMNNITDQYQKVDEERQAHINYKYDKVGNLIEKITYITADEKSYIKENSVYDYANRVIENSTSYQAKQDDSTISEQGRTLVKYSYDEEGNMLSKIEYNGEDNQTSSFSYDYRNRVLNKLETINESLNKKTKYTYDQVGNLKSESVFVNGKEHKTSYSYDGLGNIVTKTDALNNNTGYLYDCNNNLIKQIDARYAQQNKNTAPGLIYVYDSLNRLIRTETFSNNQTKVLTFKAYDARGNIIKEGSGEGYNSLAVQNSVGNYYEYDVHDRPITYISAQTVKDNGYNGFFTKKYEYDANDNVIKEIDGNGNVTEYSYYMNNQVKQKTFPDHKSISYVYDLLGMFYIAETDRANRKIKTYKNLFGKPYKIIHPDGLEENFIYDNKGNLLESIDREGNSKYFKYDKASNLIESLEYIAEDNTYIQYKLTKFSYNELGNMLTTETFEVTENKTKSSRVEKSMGDKVSYTYNENNQLVATEGPNDKQTIIGYDAAGNVNIKKVKVNNTDYDIEKYSYDVVGNLIESSVLLNTCDIESKLLANSEFDNDYPALIKATTKYSYYSTGSVKTTIDANGNKQSYSYDLDNRLVAKTDALKNITSYKYDLNGNIIEERNAQNISTFFEYDNLNRLIRTKQPFGKGDHVITRYVYDTLGNIIKEIAPNQYNAAKDNEAEIHELKGLTYSYDIMNRKTQVINPEGEILQKIEYSPNGNVQKTIDGLRLEANEGTVYEYDALGRVVKESDVFGNSKHYSYDVLGNITKQTDQKGNITRFEYNPDKTVSRVTYVDGAQVLYVYDKKGRIITQTDQRGNATLFEYNKLGKIKKVTNPLGDSKTIKSDLIGNQVVLTDEAGAKTYISYDALNRVVEKKIPIEKQGSTLYSLEKYSYDNLSRVTKKTLTGTKNINNKRETYYAYLDNNKLESVTYNSGANINYSYDKNSNIIKTISLREEGQYNIEKFVYDSSNRLISNIKLVDKIAIKSENNISSLTDNEYPAKVQLKTSYEYDILGNKTKEVAPKGQLYSKEDIRRKEYTTAYSYDKANRPKKVVMFYNGEQATIEYYYDENGNKIKEKDPKGNIATYSYDELNRVKKITDPRGSSLTYDYDLAGNKIKETNNLGNSMQYDYDELNRVTKTIDPYNKVIKQNSYDKKGRIKTITDAKGNTISYQYNLANQVTAITDAEGNTITMQYNQYGEKTKQTNGLAESTRYEYDNIGRLIKVIDALGVTTSYGYNKVNNKTFKRNGKGKITSYNYGDFGLLLTVINPEQKTIKYSYDIHLNISQQIDKKGNHHNYKYNSRNKLTEKTVTETNDSITYDYDILGNRTKMQDESGTSEYSYNEINKLLQVTKNGELEISYSYDKLGNIASVTDTKNNVTEYSYDKANRMKTVKRAGLTTTYSYDVNGNRESIEYPGGVKEEYSYNKNNQITSLANKKGFNTISSYNYTYDQAGRQETKTDSYGTTTYSYDTAGRIKQVEAPGYTTSYGYDKAGNRQNSEQIYKTQQPTKYIIKSTEEEVKYLKKTSNYSYSSANLLLQHVEKMYDEEGNELLRKTVNYLYDNNGNQLSQYTSYEHPHTIVLRQMTKGSVVNKESTEIDKLIERTKNTFDGFNRLKKVERIANGDRHIVTYTYNGDGLRTQKTSSSLSKLNIKKTTNYYYDRQHVILETDENGNESTSYVRGINYISSKNSTNITYFLYNGHGDVVQTVSKNGQVINQYNYDIFGNLTLTIETETNNIKYSGEFYDYETGLYYLRARYYNPYIGRFISEDSYWGEDVNPLSLNLYTYCENDPINYIDPSGHLAITVGEREVGNAKYTGKSTTGNLRDVIEGLGGKVDYDGKTNTVTTRIGTKTVTYDLNKVKNGGTAKADDGTEFFRTTDGRVQVRIRETAQNAGAEVHYNKKDDSVYVPKKGGSKPSKPVFSDKEILDKYNVGNEYSKEFQKKVIEHHNKTGESPETLFKNIANPEVQDQTVLTKEDHMSVLALKQSYLTNIKNKDTDKAYASLRAIDTIRQKEEYKGKYDFSDDDGNCISTYTYHNKKIESKISISFDLDPSKSAALIGSGLTALSVAPLYNILAYLLSVGARDELSEPNIDFTASNAVDGALLGLSHIKFIKDNISEYTPHFFTGLGIIKSIYDTVGDVKKWNGFKDMSISIEKDGIYDTQRFRFDPLGKLFSKTDISVYDYGIPPAPISAGSDLINPNIMLATGENIYFNNK